MKNKHLQEKMEQTFRGEHPSGLEDEAEVTFVIMQFWKLPENLKLTKLSNEVWDRLLSFQQGWKACKDFYKIND